MKNCKELLEVGYQITLQTGEVSENTTNNEFKVKLVEETTEVIDAVKDLEENGTTQSESRLISEIVDVMKVCYTWLAHQGIDIENELKINNEKNSKKIK